MTAEPCTWTQDGDPDCDTWATGCGHYFVLNEGAPSDNALNYCCYCGKPLTEKLLTWGALLGAGE